MKAAKFTAYAVYDFSDHRHSHEGYGKTEAAAFADLLRRLREKLDCRKERFFWEALHFHRVLPNYSEDGEPIHRS
jgi:hypothetical protein